MLASKLVRQSIRTEQNEYRKMIFDPPSFTHGLLSAILWLLLCSNLYSKFMSYGLISTKIVFIEDDNASPPEISLCQLALHAFTDCQLFHRNFFCPHRNIRLCSVWLFRNHSNVGQMFDKLANCSFYRRFQVLVLTQNFNLEKSRKMVQKYWPVERYFTDGMYCIHFAGNSQPNAVYSITVNEEEQLPWQAQLELFALSLRTNKLAMLSTVGLKQAHIFRRHFGQNWTYKVNEFKNIRIYFHVRNELPVSGLQNHALLQSFGFQSFVNIRKRQVHRLPSPYESKCRKYAGNFTSQKHCLQRCMSAQNNDASAFDLYLSSDGEFKVSSFLKHRPSSACLNECPPSCHEEQFYLRSSRLQKTARNQVFFQLDKQIGVIKSSPIVTLNTLIFYSFNELSIAFGWNILLLSDQLAEIVSCLLFLFLRCRFRFRLKNFLHKLISITSWGLLWLQSGQLCVLYLNFSTTTNTEIQVQTMQREYILTICFDLDETYYAESLHAYKIWFFSRTFLECSTDWNLTSQWLMKYRDRKTIVRLLSKEKRIQRRLEEISQFLKHSGTNTTNLRHQPLIKRKVLSLSSLWKKPFSHLINGTITSHEMGNEIMVEFYSAFEGIMLGANCLDFQFMDEVFTAEYKCFRIRISQAFCGKRLIRRISSYPILLYAHLYLNDGLFENLRLDNLNAVFEEKHELLSFPYSSNSLEYSTLKLAHNISCSSQAECINVCIIERSVREFERIPNNLPFLWPKYRPLLGRYLYHHIRFSSDLRHESFRQQCQQQFAQPDCIRSRFFNEFQVQHQVFQMVTINFITKQTRIQLTPRYKFVQFLLDMMGLLSLCAGLSLFNIMRTLTDGFRRLFDQTSLATSFWIRFLLLIGFAYQLWQLLDLYHSNPMSTLIQSGSSVGSVHFVPDFSLCFPFALILKDASHLSPEISKMGSTFFGSLRLKNAFSLLNSTLDLSELLESGKFLIHDKTAEKNRFYRFDRKMLSELEKAKRYKSLRLSITFFRTKKCFVFQNRIHSLLFESLITEIKLKSLTLKPSLTFYAADLENPLFSFDADFSVHVMYSYQLTTFQNSLPTCVKLIGKKDLFNASAEIQRKTLSKFGSVQTLHALDERFFQHPIVNPNVNLLSEKTRQYEHRRISNGKACILNFKFRFMSIFQRDEGSKFIKISAVTDESSLLIARALLSWDDVIVYCGNIAVFWMDISAQQLLEAIVAHMFSFKKVLSHIFHQTSTKRLNVQ